MAGCMYHGGSTGPNGLLRYCGAPTRDDSSYCEIHHARVWQPAGDYVTAAMRARERAHAAPLEENE